MIYNKHFWEELIVSIDMMGFMKYNAKIGSSAMVYISSFIKTGSGFKH
jgi:hypothetical protein